MEDVSSKDYPENFKETKTNQWALIPHLSEPDYSRPLLEIPFEARERMLGRLSFLYGKPEAEKYMP